MKLSYKQLNKLRSGQQVWRVWGNVYANDFGSYGDRHAVKLARKDERGDLYLHMYLERVVILGKKQDHWITRVNGDGKFRLGTRMILPKHLEDREYDNNFRYARFLSDMHGTAAFTKQYQAERFILDILNGLHPEIVDKKVQSYFDDKRWDELRIVDDYDYDDFDTYDGTPEGDVDF